MNPSLEVHVRVPNNLIAICGPVLIHVRNGPLTASVLDRIEHALRFFRASPAKALAVIIVLEATAPPASQAVRDRQRGIIQTLMSSERVYMATALHGLGAIFSLQRTIARGISQTSSRIHVTVSVQEATRWITKVSPGIGVDEHALRAMVEQARNMLRERDPPVPLSTRAFVK
jgi:hypothetical protein